MAKGQQRSNKEARKPKKDKAPPKGPATSVTAQAMKPNPFKGGGKKG